MYGENMDRRQRKTREAIFNAFTNLLFEKDFYKITVEEIINLADIGRATFYSHFETKDYLLKEFCAELFCHIFDSENAEGQDHRHIFNCDGSEPVFQHLFRHLQKNDNNILTLLASKNNELFLSYFRTGIEGLVESHFNLFRCGNMKNIPESFLKNHITAALIETIRWWIDNGMKESPEVITKYFLSVVEGS